MIRYTNPSHEALPSENGLASPVRLEKFTQRHLLLGTLGKSQCTKACHKELPINQLRSIEQAAHLEAAPVWTGKSLGRMP